MMAMRWTLGLTLFALGATSGWAGDEGQKKQCDNEVAVCIRQMVDKLSHRGWIGIEWDGTEKAPALTRVVAGSPAEKAGLLEGDELLAFNGVKTSEGEEVVWAEAKRSLIPGKTITLTIARKGVAKDVEVLLEPLPRPVMAQWVGNHVLEHHAAEIEGDQDEAEASRP